MAHELLDPVELNSGFDQSGAEVFLIALFFRRGDADGFPYL